MIYAISCPGKNRLEKIAKRFRPRYPIHLEEHPQVLFVSARKTTKEIYDEIVKIEGEQGLILIIGVRTYYGWASQELWEWLDVQFKAQ